jgi:RimJ/RimL family protein N-acetyltransferase
MKTEQIRLEPLETKHIADLDELARDDDVRQHTYVPSQPRPGFGREWIEMYEHGRKERTREGFAIVDAEDRSFLGLAAAVKIDQTAREAELGYILAPAARGRGVATEALRLLTQWAFARGLQRVELRIDTDNAASRRVAERCGYVYEGLLRSVHFKDGLRADMLVYSRLPGDE